MAIVYSSNRVFTRIEYQTPVKNINYKKGYVKLLKYGYGQKKIQNLVTTQEIQQISEQSPCFTSNILVIDKKDGKKRVVLNLRLINTFIKHTHFKMESINIVKNLIRRNDYMASIDIKDAFFHIPLHPSARKFFAFDFLGCRFCFKCLPFSLMSCPRIFTKILKPVIKELRSRGICIVAYLDDLLIMAKGKQALERNLKLVWNLLTELEILGFQNKLKRHDYPSPKEKDKPNEMRLQYISEEASDPYQEISVDNRKTAGNSQCSVSSKAKIMRINKIEKQNDKRRQLEHFPDIINKSFETTKIVGNPFRESVEQQRTKTLYQHSRNESNPVCVHDFQRSSRKVSLDQVRQLDMCSLPQPPGRLFSPEISAIAESIWEMCLQMKIKLKAQHLPVQQTRLDDESQNIQHDSQVMGTIQMGATNYANPPWILIPKILTNIRKERATICLIAPLWSSANIMQFLTTKANERKSYNTIAAYRSAISIFRSNPPAESGDDIYDITLFLDFIVSLEDNSRLPLIGLAKKTAFLCALLSASRPSNLARLDLTTMTNTQNGITIQCINPKEINIAIATSLCHYLDRTQNLQFTNEQRTAVFLSCIGLHRPTSIDSIANWLKNIIRKSAPDGKAKDIRVLSAILAQNGGADLNSILALENWS
ncbi:4627_t:CDS:2, partial [Gigaspora margarita]